MMSADRELVYETPPALGWLYLRAMLARRRAPGPTTSCPEFSVGVRRMGADPEAVEAYRRLCGIAGDGHLPPTYPQVLATPLHAAILAHEDFPLPAMGLVHLENRIHQRRPIAEGAMMDMRCGVSGWEWDERLGIRFAIETVVRVEGEVIWRSELWALARGEGSSLKKRDRRKKKEQAPRPGEASGRVASVMLRVPGDLGRRYAAISGDVNPIHLHRLTAKPFGFHRPIIHGMWTVARCWSVLVDMAPREGLEISARFKKPIYLPSKAWIGAERSEEGLRFVCASPEGDRVYLEGQLRESL